MPTRFLCKMATPLGFLLVLSACASPTSRFGFPSEKEMLGPNVDPAIYGMDDFVLRKEMPLRSANDFEFYYKQCEDTGRGSFISKTSYYCADVGRSW